MKPYSPIVISFLVLVSLIIIPVSAETLSGTLGGTSYSQTSGGATGQEGSEYDINFSSLHFVNIEYTGGTLAGVNFDNNPVRVVGTDVGAPAGATTTFVGHYETLAGPVVVTGTIGYQKVFNQAGTEVEGYQWVAFNNDWNLTGKTGTKYVVLDFNPAAVYNMSKKCGVGGPSGNGNFLFSSVAYPGHYARGTFLRTIGETVYASYSFTKPSGLGITGNITKTTGLSRGFIFNNDGNTIITSENTVRADPLYVNTLNSTVRPSILTSSGVWWNETTLFVPSTPTPTATPTTPAPGSWSNITFRTKYGVNSTALPNVFTKLYMYREGGPDGDDDWTRAVDGYTDSNGEITFQQVTISGWDFRVEFTKPGLYQVDFWLDPTMYSWSQTYYMYEQPPNSEIPGFPTTFNLTIQVKNANTFAAIPSAWVTIGDDISGTPYVGQSTNATGYVVFPGVPNTANINGVISKVGYVPLTYWVTSGSLLGGDTAITKYLYLTSSTVTPTITPVPQEGVTLTANPNSVAPGQSTTLTTTCANVTACTGAGGMSIVTYSEKYPDPSWDTHLIRAYKWNVTRSYYDWKNNRDDAWTATGTYTGLTATGTPTISGTNTYYVNLLRTDYYSIGTANVGVLVTGAVSGNLLMNLQAQDLTTGGHLSNYQMNLTNKNTLTLSEYGTIAYDKNVLLPRGQDYTVQCSKAGYLYGTSDFTVSVNPDIEDGDFGAIAVCPMYPTGSISGGNTTITVKVLDSENYMPLPNVQVQMSAPLIYSDSPKYTGGEGGGVFFVIAYNQIYSITASKTGYCAVTETGTNGVLETKNVYINLKYGSCLGPTPTHTQIPGITTQPSIIVTPTQFQPGNATSFWTPWINVFTHMGAGAGEINMLLAGLIIVLLMGAGAGMAGILGAEVAMGFGAIFCVAIGLIPIWVVLAIIILGFLFYGLKIGR